MSAISFLVGDGITRSTTSLIIDKATPMDEITSAFSGILYPNSISLEVYGSNAETPPPTPTRDI